MDSSFEEQTPQMPIADPPPELTSTPPAAPGRRQWFWQGKIGPAFRTIASLISLTVNVVLLIILILLGQQLFALKGLIAGQLVGGLHRNFVLMDQARIVSAVQVDDTIQVKFDLPVNTTTVVKLTEDTRIQGARVNLSTGGLTIRNAPANIVLPAGTDLPIALNITVPVDTIVPVKLNVPVDIPLNQTELHQPFVGLQEVIAPYDQLLAKLPNSWLETPLCAGWSGWLCRWMLETK